VGRSDVDAVEKQLKNALLTRIEISLDTADSGSADRIFERNTINE
jgi:molybdenum cofactor biosynthesis enzyme MoaA